MVELRQHVKNSTIAADGIGNDMTCLSGQGDAMPRKALNEIDIIIGAAKMRNAVHRNADLA